MADGSTKAIKNVTVGDKVMATDPESGVTRVETVTSEIKGKSLKHLVKVTIDTDGKKGTKTADVTATDRHPFWVPELGKWTDATDLQAGQWLQTGAGTRVQVTAIKRWTTYDVTVHNLSVSNLHTYYVLAEATPVLVHNCNDAPDDADVEIFVDSEKYPESAQHVLDAQEAGHPKVLTINRGGAKENRKASLKGHPTVAGKQRDEYPPAMFEEGGAGASVRPITSGDNGGAGSTFGNQLRPYPNGTRVRFGVK